MIAAPLFIGMLLALYLASHGNGYIRDSKGRLVPESATVRFLVWVSGLFKS